MQVFVKSQDQATQYFSAKKSQEEGGISCRMQSCAMKNGKSSASDLFYKACGLRMSRRPKAAMNHAMQWCFHALPQESFQEPSVGERGLRNKQAQIPNQCSNRGKQWIRLNRKVLCRRQCIPSPLMKSPGMPPVPFPPRT